MDFLIACSQTLPRLITQKQLFCVIEALVCKMSLVRLVLTMEVGFLHHHIARRLPAMLIESFYGLLLFWFLRRRSRFG